MATTPEIPLTLRPAVGENAIYLAQGNRLAAWNVSDGLPRWPAVVLDSEISAAPVALGDQVVVATGGRSPRVWWFGSDSRPIEQAPVEAPITEISAAPGVLVYIDERGVGRLGDVQWHTPVEDVQSVAISVDHGLAVVTVAPGVLKAFDLGNGSQRWQYDAGGPITRADVAADRLFVGGGEQGLLALRVANGRLLWKRSLGTGVEGAPAHAQDLVWVAGLDAQLHAFKAGNGTQMGQLTTDLSSRNYLDIASFEPWVVVGALYGPWLAVRGPTRAERAGRAIGLPVRQPNAVGRPDLKIPAGTGAAGVAVVNGDGSVVFLQPQRAR